VTCLAKKKLEGDFPPNFSFSSDHTRNTSIFKDLSTVFNEMVELKKQNLSDHEIDMKNVFDV
jgi:hypothetical protein